MTLEAGSVVVVLGECLVQDKGILGQILTFTEASEDITTETSKHSI